MAEQPHPWGEGTLEVTPQDPWADPPQPTRPIGPTAAEATRQSEAPRPPEGAHAFSRGVAHVKPAMPRTESFTAAHEPTGTGWPGAEPPQPRQSLAAQVRQLRRGSEWSSAAALFAFICWGVWTISGTGDLASATLIFGITLLVAVGLFGLSRLVGRIVLERQLGRVRRTATGSHLLVAVFLVGVGVAYLGQVGWIVDAWGWVTGVR